MTNRTAILRSSARVRMAKAGSRIRRRLLGLMLRFVDDETSDPSSLLARFPDEALMPLRRNSLDPVPELARKHAEGPVTRLKMPFGLRGWLVTGHDESKTILAADHETFSNDFSNMIGKVGIAAEQDPGGLGFADPPAHSRLRKMLTAQFTVRGLAPWEPRIAEIINQTLDDLEVAAIDNPIVDLQQHFAVPVPSRIIMSLIGIEDSGAEEFHRLSTSRFDFASGAVGSLDVIAEAIHYLEEIVARQRVEGGSGLIASILREYGNEVSDVELAGLIDGVLTGGFETTVSMLSLGAVLILTHPPIRDALLSDDSYAEPFVEEALRYLSVVQVGFPRFARRDVQVGGQTMFEGDIVVCSLAAANRDPLEFPQQIDASRATTGHLAFGYGLHRCIGAELARIELRMAFQSMLRRFPQMSLAVPADELPYRKLSIIHGLERLPVRLR